MCKAQVGKSESPLPFKPPLFTLDRLIQQVEAYYPKLQGAEVERRIAASKRLEKQGAFDPSIFINSDYLGYNSTTTPGKLSTTTTTDVALEIPTPYGLKFIAGGRFHYGKVKSPDSSTGQSGEYFMMIKMPLLRGAGINEKATAARQALLGIPLADQFYTQARVEILQKAIQNYWKWAASARKLEVQRNLLKIAEARAQFIADRIKEGDLPKAEQPLADSEVQQRLVLVYAAERTLQQAAYDLGLYLFDAEGNPTPTPSALEVPEYLGTLTMLTPEQIDEARKMALSRRPELKALALMKDQTQLDLRLARNDRLPALDLVYSPGQDTGLGGVGTTMKAGVMVTIPLLTRGADGRVQQARQKIQKISLDEAESRNRILTSVNDAVNAINIAVARYSAAKQGYELAKIAEENERERYRNGDTTLINVNQLERATAQAASTIIDIEAEYEQGIAAFYAATLQPFTRN
jgi:outer membrane protein TolC